MIGIARHPIAQNFGIDLGAARLGVFVFLKNHDPRALAHDETVTVGIIRAAGLLRIIPALG